MQVILAEINLDLGALFSQLGHALMKGVYWLMAQLANICNIVITTVRALAGLETYSYGSSTINPSEPAKGDIVINFLQEQGLINVFISLFVLAIVLLFIVTFISVIKSEWSPVSEAKGNNKFAVISKSIRALLNFITVPVVAILGIIVGNELLKALDGATNGGNYSGISSIMMRCITENATWADLNNVNAKKIIGDNTGSIEINGETYRGIYSIFVDSSGYNSTSINNYFENSYQVPTDVRIKLDNVSWINNNVADKLNERIAAGEAYFSYQDTDMVSIFFNLSKVDYIGGIVVLFIVTKYMFIISFGLVKRIYSISVLLLVSPPVVAVTPLQPDALKSWRKSFIQNVLAAYGSIVGCNLFFSLMPYIRNIKLFSTTLLNNFVTLMFIAAGAMFIQDFGKLINDIIGGSDLYKDSSDKGKSLWRGVGETAGNAISTVGGAPVRLAKDVANFGATVRYKGWGAAFKNAGNNIKNTATKNSGFLSGLNGGLNPINALDKDTEKARNEERQEVRTRRWEDKTGLSTARDTLQEEIKNDQGKLDVLNQNQARRNELENLGRNRTEDEEKELQILNKSADEEKEQRDALNASLKKSKDDLELLSKVKAENGKIKGTKQMPKGTWKKAREEREKAKQENIENVEKAKKIIADNDARAKKIVENLGTTHGEEDAKKDYNASQDDNPKA